jgi:hypothetical protein
MSCQGVFIPNNFHLLPELELESDRYFDCRVG